MRDPARIDRIIRKLRIAWYTNPDSRLTQLVLNNSLSDRRTTTQHVFHMEDDELERRLDEWIARYT